MKLPASPLTPPVKLMDCLPFSFTFRMNIHRARLHVALQLRIFRLDRIEIVELVQPQNAQFPEAVVEYLAFVEQQFAPDHFVARGGVSGEFDAANEELLLLVEIQRQIDHLLRVVHVEGGSALKSMYPYSP